MRNPLPLLVLAVLFAAGGLWLWWVSGSASAAPHAPGAPGAAALGGGPAVPAGETGSPQAGSSQSPFPSPDQVDLEVDLDLVVHDRLLAPIAAVRVVDNNGRAQGLAVSVAGAGAVLGSFLSAPGRGPSLLRWQRSDGRVLYRRAVVEDGVAVLTTRGETAIRGRVVDGEGRPIGDALIWCGEGPLTSSDGALRTDADGQFSVVLAGGSGVPLVVRANGHAARVQFLDVPAAGLTGVRVALDPGASLRVSLVGAVAEPERALVFVLPGGGQHTALLAWPFFLQGMLPAACDEDGVAILRGLPQGVPLRIAVRHPWTQPGFAGPVTLSAVPGATAVSLGAVDRRFAGGVVDAGGGPVEGAWIVAKPRGGVLFRPFDGHWLLPAAARLATVAAAPVAADGSYGIGVYGDAVVALCDGPVDGGVEKPLPSSIGGGRLDFVLRSAVAPGPVELEIAPPPCTAWRVRYHGREQVLSGQLPFILSLDGAVVGDLVATCRGKVAQWADVHRGLVLCAARQRVQVRESGR